MFTSFGYAVTAVDGKGNYVCPEQPRLDDLDECYGTVMDFMGPKGDAVFQDALDRLYSAHQGADEEEPSITWEVRCIPLLKLV